MASRTELKATFSAGQSLVESDFNLLIESLAHKNDDIANGSIASGQSVTELQSQISALTALSNQTQQNLNDYIAEHPTLTQVQEGDQAITDEFGTRITNIGQAVAEVTATLDTQQDLLDSKINAINNTLTADISTVNLTLGGISSNYASQSLLDVKVADLTTLISSKSPVNHVHSDYLTASSLLGYVKSEDLTDFAPSTHSHNVTEIVGVDDLFMTPAETLSMIRDNKVLLDESYTIADKHYDKEEVDQKFYVARWRTDQVSLFTPSVVSIAQPLVDLAKQEIEVSIANVRVSLFTKEQALYNHSDQVRNEIEVSIYQANSRTTALENTVTTNRVHEDAEFASVRTSIGVLTNSLKASISVTRTDALAAVSSLRAEAGADDATTLSSANTYTDTKISGLLNGAGDAYNTLKELQEHITTNDSSAALALTTQVGLLQAQITSNDGDLGGVVVSLGTIHGLIDAVELRATTLESQDVIFQNNLATFQTTYDNLIASNVALTAAYDALLARVETLENTAYMEAGYVFP